MSDQPEQEQRQERSLRQSLDRALRGLPHRPAPGTLQARVLGELQRRAAQPWWRRSFAHWPLPARMAFVAVCIGFGGLALLGSDWTVTALGSLRPAAATAMFPAQQIVRLVSVVTSLVAVPTHLIPPAWLCGVLAAGAMLYAMLFGLGALAYRTLYFKPLDGR